MYDSEGAKVNKNRETSKHFSDFNQALPISHIAYTNVTNAMSKATVKTSESYKTPIISHSRCTS